MRYAGVIACHRIACLLSGLIASNESRADSDFKVTLIGTGSPIHGLIVSGQVLLSKPAIKSF